MTKIPWVHVPGYRSETLNAIVGCSRCSEGCRECYAIRSAHCMAGNPKTPQYHGLTCKRNSRIDWTGEVRLVEHKLAVL
jgi:protein gp37